MNKIIILSSDSKSLYRFRANLIDKLIEGNNEVICYCSEDDFFEEAKALFAQKQVQLHALNFFNTKKNIFQDIKTFLKLISIFSQLKPTYIFSYHVKPVLYSAIACFFFPKIKVLPTITGLGYVFISPKTSDLILRKILLNLYRLSFIKSKKVFFHNQDDLDLFLKDNLISSEKALVVNGSGVDLTTYTYHEMPKTTSFICIARLHKDKGILEYIAACSNLKKQYHNMSFKLIASHSNNPTSLNKEEISKKCLEVGIEYIEEVKDVRPWLIDSAVFVLPSYREGLPRVGIEALAIGRPIITTNAPGCKEIVIEGVNGYAVPPKNVPELEEAMLRMIHNYGMLPGMSLASRALAEYKFDVNQITAAMIEQISN